MEKHSNVTINTDYMFECNRHIHTLKGFYNPNTYDYHIIHKIKLLYSNKYNCNCDLQINEERLKLLLERALRSDLKLNKYDKKIEYPTDMTIENFDINKLEILIEYQTLNEHTELYKFKKFQYDIAQDTYKSQKYNSKLKNAESSSKLIESNTQVLNNFVTSGGNGMMNKTKNIIGGANVLIKDIPTDVCITVTNEKPTKMIEIYSEPLTNVLLEIIDGFLIYELYMPSYMMTSDKFLYIKGEIGAQYYYNMFVGTPPISYDNFKTAYLDMHSIIDNIVRSNGIDTVPQFISAYTNHFKKEQFENNSWKTRIMFDHLLLHKYAHNGISNEDTVNIIEIIYLLQLDDVKDIWSALQFIHSIAHIYDDIYMRIEQSYEMINSKSYLSKIKTEMFGTNEQQFDCLRQKINKHRSDFLEKVDDMFNLPYQIKHEAYGDKKRQYFDNPPLIDIYKPFIDQVATNLPYIKTGETPEMYLENYI